MTINSEKANSVEEDRKKPVNNLFKYRSAIGMSVEELSENSGVSMGTIEHIEAGNFILLPHYDELKELGKALRPPLSKAIPRPAPYTPRQILNTAHIRYTGKSSLDLKPRKKKDTKPKICPDCFYEYFKNGDCHCDD